MEQGAGLMSDSSTGAGTIALTGGTVILSQSQIIDRRGSHCTALCLSTTALVTEVVTVLCCVSYNCTSDRGSHCTVLCLSTTALLTEY